VVEYLPGWAIWGAFSVTFDDPALPAIVRLDVVVTDGRPKVRGLVLTARGAEVVDGTVLRRIPVATLLEYAIAAAVMPQDEPGSDDEPDEPVIRAFKTPADFRAFRALKPRHDERRWQLTPEVLQEVVSVYRRATSAPVQEVARHFNKPRATASRWIAKARAEGYFDAPNKRTRTTTTKRAKSSRKGSSR